MWLYNGEPFTEDMIGDYYGFVYEITNNITNRKYIGRKFFTSAGYKVVKGKRKKLRKPSDWLIYYGSSSDLHLDIEKYSKENFTRTILRLCPNISSCSYYESKLIFEHDAILSDDYYNQWISCKISSMHVNAIKKTKKTS
jgi:hypothetical protein